MAVSTQYRLLIESERDSKTPISILVDGTGDGAIIEWEDPATMDERYGGSSVVLDRDEVLDLIGILKGAIGIEDLVIEGPLSESSQEELRRAGFRPDDETETTEAA